MQTHLFWAQGRLSQLERMCMASLVRQGYAPSLWTYGGVDNAPAGVSVCDARDILPESALFLNRRGSYAGFSDLFRYAVLHARGGLYTDTDVFALKPPAALPSGPFVVTEHQPRQQIQVNGNVLCNPVPRDGNLVDLARAYAERFPKSDIVWSEIGPSLLTGIVNMHPRHGFEIMPPEFANPVEWWRCPAALLTSTALPQDAAFLHLYNETWRRAGIDKDAPFPADSLMARLAVHTLGEPVPAP